MVGTVATVLRYPVKSMLGESVSAARVDDGGVEGDRSHALLDGVTGRVASAKNPRLWRGLLRMAARAGDVDSVSAVSIVLPGGAIVGSSDPGVDDLLSRQLGRPVSLVAHRAPGASIERADPEAAIEAGAAAELPMAELTLGAGSPGKSFVDFAPLHLITAGTLDRIGELSPRGTVEAARYRPNLVLNTDSAGFVENGWVDEELAVGEEVVLRIIAPTPRCAVPSLAQGTLLRDPEAVRVPFKHNRLEVLGQAATGCAGVYAEVVRPGTVRAGDPVRLGRVS